MSRADRPNPVRSALAGLLAACLALGAIAAPASAQLILERDQVRELQGVEVEERLGGSIPLDAVFTNDAGETVALGDYFQDGKPAILVLVYFDCPVVCSIVLDRVLVSLNALDYNPGEEYRLLVVSFDHRESTSQAMGHKLRFMNHFDRARLPGVSEGVVYHTGDETNIRRLTDAVGFHFIALANGEWSHPAGIMVLSPEGRVMRYLYGYDYPPDQVKLSLLDASDGKVARSLGERIMHFCFRYDPTAGAYSLEAMALMRLAGAATVVLLVILISALLIGERLRRRTRPDPSNLPGGPSRNRGRTPPDRYSPEPAGQVS